jgi:hypothetical protein
MPVLPGDLRDDCRHPEDRHKILDYLCITAIRAAAQHPHILI